MGSNRTVVCVKEVKQEIEEEWDENMPLPGDIIEGVSEDFEIFVPAKVKAELNSLLRKFYHQLDIMWIKVRRGERVTKLRVGILPEGCTKLPKSFTIRAVSDDRHVAVLGDLTLEQCTELQEMSRRMMNLELMKFNQKEMKYDWDKVVGTHLPDQQSTVLSSVLFKPLSSEHSIDATTVRTMAWFSAAVSSGVPLVFVNIQTEPIVTTKRDYKWEEEIIKERPYSTIQIIMRAIRLWILPGVSEISLQLTPKIGETRFGMDITRTQEGFICICSVTEGTAAGRAGLIDLHERAQKTSHLVVISRLNGKSLMPSSVNSAGLIQCCDHTEIKEELIAAMDRMESVRVRIMSWPSLSPHHAQKPIGAPALWPPK